MSFSRGLPSSRNLHCPIVRRRNRKLRKLSLARRTKLIEKEKAVEAVANAPQLGLLATMKTKMLGFFNRLRTSPRS